MTFYYYKRGSVNVAELTCYDYTKANSVIVFDELVIKETEQFYIFTAHAQKITDCQASKSSESSFTADSKIRFKIARKEYEKQDYKTKEKISVSPTLIEQAICKVLDSLDIDKWCFKGQINFAVDTSDLICFISGKSSSGGTLEDSASSYIKDKLCTLSPFDKSNLKHLTDEDLNIENGKGNGGGNGNYKPPKSEGERLQEKLLWMSEQIKIKFPAVEINSYYDITSDGIAAQQVPDDVKTKMANYVLELQVFVLGWSK